MGRAIVATRKGMFEIRRDGSAWAVSRAFFLGDNVTLALHDPRTHTIYAAMDHGHFGCKMHRSRDDGKTWQEIAAPAYPEPPGGKSPDTCPMSHVEIPWTCKLIWALAAGANDQPGRLWCGTVPGGLFRSDDDGQTWQMVRTLWDRPERQHWFGGGLDYPGIHSVCVDPRDSNHVTVGVSCGGVWVTRDGGESWACRADGMRAAYMPPDRTDDPNIQDPHAVAQCQARPNVLWAQHHNGVFRTVDGCTTWQEIEVPPSSFGFAVAVHPEDGDTAWLVPAIKDEMRIPVDGKVVVSRTRDGGQSFDILRQGLPQKHAYDLTFRHALDVNRTGNTLMFGSTTGSLWVSEDQGESSSTVTTHLPPVHCVRFA